MKAFAFLMCLLGSLLAAPAPDSGSNEEGITGHASTALQLMELYRMLGQLQQQGFGAVASPAQQPAAPAAPAPVYALPKVLPQRPEQHFFFNPALLAHRGDGSDEEGAFRGFYPPYGYQPAQPAAPLNSDEAEAGEEAAVAEGVEAVEGAEAGAEAAPEPTGGAPAVDAGVANEILPVNVAIDVPVTAVDPAPDVIATAAANVDPALIPQEPSVAVEIDTTMVGPEVATGGEQVLMAEDPGAGLTV